MYGKRGVAAIGNTPAARMSALMVSGYQNATLPNTHPSTLYLFGGSSPDSDLWR